MPPALPELEERAARAIVAAYTEAETDLVALLARRAAAGRSTTYDDWARAKLAETRAVLAAVEARVADLDGVVAQLIRDAVNDTSTAVAVAGTPATVVTIADQATTALQATHFGILRSTQDAYRQVQAVVAARMATGTVTLPQAIQGALDRFADRGITGFVDSAGRSWGLQEYGEMVTRTAVGRAHVATQLDNWQQQGEQLVIVSDSPEECPQCRPWEGKVLAIQGPARRPAVATVADATAAGLFHPNCTHSLGVYVEGLTRRPRGTANPIGYQERQQQRYHERQVRKWKRRQQAAVTDEARAHSARHLAAARARYRGFIRDNDRIPEPWRLRVLS